LRRHGPYFQWTRKVANKTVGRWLSAEQRDDHRVWVDNDHSARQLLARLEALGIAALESEFVYSTR
jgi:N-acetyl-anhydromuramyl-L-alanine amidase AmpD